MKKVVIAFDIDGTLRSNKIEYEHGDSSNVFINERIRSLLVALSSFKNVKIMVWSGGGELYARQVAKVIGVDPYVKYYASKDWDGAKPDIAIDDIQECDLGEINLIVREK